MGILIDVNSRIHFAVKYIALLLMVAWTVDAAISGFPRVACPTCECSTCANCTQCDECLPLAAIVSINSFCVDQVAMSPTGSLNYARGQPTTCSFTILVPRKSFRFMCTQLGGSNVLTWRKLNPNGLTNALNTYGGISVNTVYTFYDNVRIEATNSETAAPIDCFWAQSTI